MNRFKKALKILRAGGIVAHATETCYGFACDIFNQRALARLYQIKKMPYKQAEPQRGYFINAPKGRNLKPVSIMVGNLAMAKKYGIFNKTVIKLAKKYWPGALTIIVKRKKILPSFFNPGIKTIGIRCPAHKLSRELIKKFGSPLTTTSANISGKSSPYSVTEIKRQFQNQKIKPDFILNDGRLKKNPPSTIVDISQRTLKILRQGDINVKL